MTSCRECKEINTKLNNILHQNLDSDINSNSFLKYAKKKIVTEEFLRLQGIHLIIHRKPFEKS